MIWIILGIVVWYLIGFVGCIYVEHLTNDIDSEFLMAAFRMVLFGILFPIIYISNNPKVIIKKRKIK